MGLTVGLMNTLTTQTPIPNGYLVSTMVDSGIQIALLNDSHPHCVLGAGYYDRDTRTAHVCSHNGTLNGYSHHALMHAGIHAVNHCRNTSMTHGEAVLVSKSTTPKHVADMLVEFCQES